MVSYLNYTYISKKINTLKRHHLFVEVLLITIESRKINKFKIFLQIRNYKCGFELNVLHEKCPKYFFLLTLHVLVS